MTKEWSGDRKFQGRSLLEWSFVTGNNAGLLYQRCQLCRSAVTCHRFGPGRLDALNSD